MPGVRIEGVSDLLHSFDEAPNELMKAVRKAIREIVTDEAGRLKNAAPAASDLVKTKTKTTKQGNVFGRVGFVADHKGEGLDMHWFHWYWKNYGTLKRRDPSHIFDYAIKPDRTEAAKKRRNREGQFPENYFDRAIKGFDRRALNTFIESLRQQGYDIK